MAKKVRQATASRYGGERTGPGGLGGLNRRHDPEVDLEKLSTNKLSLVGLAVVGVLFLLLAVAIGVGYVGFNTAVQSLEKAGGEAVSDAVGYVTGAQRWFVVLGTLSLLLTTALGALMFQSARHTREAIKQQFEAEERRISEAQQTEYRMKQENDYLQEQVEILLEVTNTAAGGDLSKNAEESDGAIGSVAKALNTMFENIGDLIDRVRDAANRIASSAQQIQVAAEQLAGGAAEQDAQLSSVSTSIQEMGTNTEVVAENASQGSEAAKRALEAAEDGARRVHDVIDGMNRIQANVQAGVKKVKLLGERSMEINRIVDTINQISVQTDMLALNAAIEAARAGEHGRGFAVVAEEIRKLAESTARATSEITQLVESIQAETNETVTVIEHQTTEVENQVKSVQSAGAALTHIREVSQRSTELVNEISNATAEQAHGARGVVDSVEHISEIAKQTRIGAEQTKATTESLNELAEELRNLLMRFRTRHSPDGQQQGYREPMGVGAGSRPALNSARSGR